MILALIAFGIYALGCFPGQGIAKNFPPPTANSQENSITMPSLQSKSIDPNIKKILERQIQAWETADSERVIADFAEDSWFIVPGSTFKGKQQIKEVAKKYFSEFTDTKVTVKRIIVNGNEGTLE